MDSGFIIAQIGYQRILRLFIGIRMIKVIKNWEKNPCLRCFRSPIVPVMQMPYQFLNDAVCGCLYSE